MAVAAPARRTAPAPAPSRKRPLRPTRSRPSARAAVGAPARQAPARKAPAREAPTRKAPARTPRARATAQRAVAGGQLIPLAVGRTAVAVSQLPDSGLVVRMTRGRAWIAVLGILLVGIVGLNVITLSFAASSGKIDEQMTALEQENSILRGRDAQKSGIGAVRNAAAPLGLTMPNTDEVHVTEASSGNVATAAARLAAAGSG